MTITVTCPSCASTFPVDPKKIPEKGVHARCSTCRDIFFVEKPAAHSGSSAAEPTPDDVTPAAPVSAASGETEEPERSPAEDATTGAPTAEAASAPPAEHTAPDAPPEETTQDDWSMEGVEGWEEGPSTPAPDDLQVEQEGATLPSETPAPSDDTPAPSDEMPAPSDEMPAPSDDTPAPSVDAGDVPPRDEIPEAGVESRTGEVVPESQIGGEVRPEGGEAPEGVPEPTSPPPAFQLGRRDPHDKARRLARVLVSDMIMYNPERHARALESGTLEEDFDEEIRKSWEEYVEQVGGDMAGETSYFRDALNEILARGADVFDGTP